MTIIDTRPQIVDILHYSGNTLILNLTSTDDYSGATWTGQVRLSPNDVDVDGTFTFVPNATGAVATLSAAVSTALCNLGSQVVENGQTFMRYNGVYDIQYVKDTNTYTVMRGKITVDADVTRGA